LTLLPLRVRPGPVPHPVLGDLGMVRCARRGRLLSVTASEERPGLVVMNWRPWTDIAALTHSCFFLVGRSKLELRPGLGEGGGAQGWWGAGR